MIVIASLFSIYLVFKYTIAYFYPFLIAILFSLMLNPFISFLEKNIHINRSFATLFSMFIFFILFIGITFIIISKLIQGTAYLADQIPFYFYTVIDFIEEIIRLNLLPIYYKITSLLNALNAEQQATINENIQELTQQIAASGADILQSILLKLSSILSWLPSSITVIIVILLATFLISNDLPFLKETVTNAMPKVIKNSSKNIVTHFKKGVLGYFKAQLILITITACIIFFSLLVLRIEHALTITLLTMVADFLPYIGTGIVFIPWIIYLFFTKNYLLTITLTVLYVFIIITRQVFEPKLLASSLGLNPLAALMALFLGIKIWGLFGLIIAPIMMIVFQALHQAGITAQLYAFIKG